MIVLLDRDCAVQAVAEAVARTGAHVPVRVTGASQAAGPGTIGGRFLPVRARMRSGQGHRLRITLSTVQGHRTCAYRLVTTLT